MTAPMTTRAGKAERTMAIKLGNAGRMAPVLEEKPTPFHVATEETAKPAVTFTATYFDTKRNPVVKFDNLAKAEIPYLPDVPIGASFHLCNTTSTCEAT